MNEKELEQFLQSIENEPLLTAPNGMKESIMERVKVREQIKAKKKSTELFFYSLKISAAAVAAILLLCVINIQGNVPNEGFKPGDRNTAQEFVQQEERDRESKSITKTLQDASNSWSEALHDFSNTILNGKNEGN